MGILNRLFSRRSAWDGGSHGRDNASWAPIGGTGEELNQFSRDTVRARLRDLERNSDNVAAIVDTGWSAMWSVLVSTCRPRSSTRRARTTNPSTTASRSSGAGGATPSTATSPGA